MSSVDRARELVAYTFDLSVDEVTTASTSDDVPGWDSFGHVTLMMALEESLGTAVDVTEMASLTSVTAIADLLEGRSP
jgi:acyl carrier protein